MQVTHHGVAERAGLGEAVPLLEQRRHDVGDEPWEREGGEGPNKLRDILMVMQSACRPVLTYLNSWDRVSLLVTQRTDLHVELSLQVTCQVNRQNPDRTLRRSNQIGC